MYTQETIHFPDHLLDPAHSPAWYLLQERNQNYDSVGQTNSNRSLVNMVFQDRNSSSVQCLCQVSQFQNFCQPYLFLFIFLHIYIYLISFVLPSTFNRSNSSVCLKATYFLIHMILCFYLLQVNTLRSLWSIFQHPESLKLIIFLSVNKRHTETVPKQLSGVCFNKIIILL